ncbi:MAG: hypothetical protein GX330_02470 [Bacteroidales bacterium]|nr:hypothetical protein [Bacteroidales bacterium]
MHRKHIVFLIFINLILLFGCTKPEDRIRGQWQVSKVLKNNVIITNESPSEVENYLSSWTFYQSKIVIIKYQINATIYETSGKWSIDKKNDILTVSFSDRYYDIAREYTIEKFKSNELQVSFVDENQVKWKIVFALLYSLQDYEM